MRQVTTTVLKNGDRLQSDMVVVGVGAKPTGEMFNGQIDFLETRPGGIKVRMRAVFMHDGHTGASASLSVSFSDRDG